MDYEKHLLQARDFAVITLPDWINRAIDSRLCYLLMEKMESIMPVSQMSKNIYFDIQMEKITQKEQRRILNRLKRKDKEMTRKEIAFAEGMETSSVSARVNMMMGVVLEEGTPRKCKISGRVVGTVKRKLKGVV